MDLSLHNKRAIVCGSTQGIGKAIAIELARMGASITLIARDESKLKLVVKELGDGKHNYIVADFSNLEVFKVAIATQISDLGPVHILINNTGGPPAGPALDAKLEDFLAAFSSHLLCNQLLIQACVPLMKQAGFGRIINIISTSVKQPIPGLGVSNTIRGAVANWSKTLSIELAPFGITVNNVLPGATSTQRLENIINAKAGKTGKEKMHIENEMLAEIPAKRFGSAEEIAAAAAFLASPAAGYINGVNLPVDGGRTACL